MRIKKIGIILICVVVASGITTFAAYMLLSDQGQPSAALEFEDNATVGVMPGVDLAKRKEELQEKLDQTKIAFSINTNPEFYDGTAKGNLMIENPQHNNKYLVAEIYLVDNNELIYQSKALKPGTYLETVNLDKALQKGEYRAIAYFKGYDLDSEQYVGQTGAEITLHIDN